MCPLCTLFQAELSMEGGHRALSRQEHQVFDGAVFSSLSADNQFNHISSLSQPLLFKGRLTVVRLAHLGGKGQHPADLVGWAVLRRHLGTSHGVGTSKLKTPLCVVLTTPETSL